MGIKNKIMFRLGVAALCVAFGYGAPAFQEGVMPSANSRLLYDPSTRFADADRPKNGDSPTCGVTPDGGNCSFDYECVNKCCKLEYDFNASEWTKHECEKDEEWCTKGAFDTPEECSPNVGYWVAIAFIIATAVCCLIPVCISLVFKLIPCCWACDLVLCCPLNSWLIIWIV